MKTAVVRARIPETLKKEFEAAAAAHGWNLSHAIRQLMNQYVAREKEMARRHRETLGALEDIEAGRVVDGTSVLKWLSGWGTDDEKKPPL
jgi:predicted transcriptional regulator